jgi:hypothetical protein
MRTFREEVGDRIGYILVDEKQHRHEPGDLGR